MTLIRINPALPPRAKNIQAARTMLICYRAAWKHTHTLQYCARHLLEAASLTVLANDVHDEASKMIENLDAEITPIGSGRSQARDNGGRILYCLNTLIHIRHPETHPHYRPEDISKANHERILHKYSFPNTWNYIQDNIPLEHFHLPISEWEFIETQTTKTITFMPQAQGA